MSITTAKENAAAKDLGLKLVYFLTVFMVIVGLINATPGIPGYDDIVARITGINGATFRKFPFEWFYPAFFCSDDADCSIEAFTLAGLG